MTFTVFARYLCLVVLVIQGMTNGIRITRLVVPETLVVGDSTWLNCEWEEEDDHVYTLKWYLGLHEFYRWTPAEDLEEKIFPLPSAFHIDHSRSSRGQVHISNVTLAATGNFRCEISGEAPFFKTSFETSTLTVFDLPDGKPTITGLKPMYRLRDFIDVNCTSHNAKPAPELTFYINNNVADPGWITNYTPVVENTGLLTVTKRLRFQLHPNIPTTDRMLVKCTSGYPYLYFESTDKVIKIDLPHYYPVTSDFLPEDYPAIDSGGSTAVCQPLPAAVLLFSAVVSVVAFIR